MGTKKKTGNRGGGRRKGGSGWYKAQPKGREKPLTGKRKRTNKAESRIKEEKVCKSRRNLRGTNP